MDDTYEIILRDYMHDDFIYQITLHYKKVLEMSADSPIN